MVLIVALDRENEGEGSSVGGCVSVCLNTGNVGRMDSDKRTRRAKERSRDFMTFWQTTTKNEALQTLRRPHG